MLNDSIVGKIYTLWVQSFCFALLQRLWRPVRRAFHRSAILHALFTEGALERAYRESGIAALLRWVCRLVLRILRWFAPVTQAPDTSVAMDLLRGSVLRPLARLEGLFGAFVFVMFVVPHAYWNNLYTVLAAFAFLLLYLLLAAAGRRSFLQPEALGLGVLIFLLSLFLSMGFTAARRDSMRILLFFLASLSMCYFIAASFREPKRLRQLLAFLYAALLIISLYAIAQNVLGLVEENSSFTDLELNKGVPGRVYSTLNNPVNLSEFILLFLPLSAAFAAGAKRVWQRVLLAAALVLPAMALVLTYSRGGWIAVMLAAAVFTYCCNKRVIPALLVLGVLAVPMLPESVLIRLSTIGNRKDSSTLHRLYLWQGIARLLADHDRFLTGIGLGPQTFRMVYPFYAVGPAKVGAYHSQMHYLELVLELGLPGLLGFMYMMFKYLGRAGDGIRRHRSTRLILIACVSSVAALAFVGMVEYIWFYQRIMFAFFIFLGILLAAAGSTEPEAIE